MNSDHHYSFGEPEGKCWNILLTPLSGFVVFLSAFDAAMVDGSFILPPQSRRCQKSCTTLITTPRPAGLLSSCNGRTKPKLLKTFENREGVTIIASRIRELHETWARI